MKNYIHFVSLVLVASMFSSSQGIAEDEIRIVRKQGSKTFVESKEIIVIVFPEYDPEEKADPFESFISEPVPVVARKLYKTDCISHHAFETLDLCQLKLAEIVLAESGNRGLVQKASGKGHIIQVGYCLGKHGRKVSSILSDRIIIHEEMEDAYGNISVREIELKLQKPKLGFVQNQVGHSSIKPIVNYYYNRIPRDQDGQKLEEALKNAQVLPDLEED